MKKDRTCCSLLITSSGLPRPVLKCPRFWAGCLLRWVTSLPWRRRWVNLQERITSTKKGSVTSIQAIYVPADDYTDPAPATAFAHLDATTILERACGNGIYPAVDPLASTSRILTPESWGRNTTM